MTKKRIEFTKEMVRAMEDNGFNFKNVKKQLERDTGLKVKVARRRKFRVRKARSF